MLQEGGLRGLDYFMVKVNTDSLKRSIGSIKPINLDDTVDAVNYDDMVYIIQYPGGRKQHIAFSVCFYTDGKPMIRIIILNIL